MDDDADLLAEQRAYYRARTPATVPAWAKRVLRHTAAIPGSTMPTETTASLLIGPLDTQWGASVFGPDHVLLLREGGRATWTVTRIDPDTETAPSFIRPESPDHLLAASVLGFAALVVPDLVDGSPHLRDTVGRELDGVSVRPVDLDLARRVFAWSSELVDGLVTVLPGSSIGDEELALAASHGFRIAVAGNSTTDGAR